MGSTSTPIDTGLANMPPPTADIQETWTYLNKGVEHIMTNGEHELSFKAYTSFYSTVYNYCTSTKMEGKVDGNRTGAKLMAPNLYDKLSQYLVAHSKGILEKADTLEDIDLLQYYAGEWDRYTRGAKYLNRLFNFLNRHWVKRERDEREKALREGKTDAYKGKEDVYEVYTLALVQWKAHFLMQIQKDNAKLTNAVLKLISQERNGDVVDQDLIKQVIDSFVSLGLDNADPEKECLDVYKEQFESAFLDATETYYKQESEAFLAAYSISDYLKKADERLREEENRVERYLHNSTRKDLLSPCERVLIWEHSELMGNSFQSLLDSHKDEDLQRMYALVLRIPEGLEPLRKRLEGHAPPPTSSRSAGQSS